MIRVVKDKDCTLAIVFRPEDDAGEGIDFITEDNHLLQLGYMKYQGKKLIQPHVHTPFKRETTGTSEVIYIKSGKVRADFYTNEQIFVEALEITEGAWLILIDGGHGFEILEPTEMIEVKNGPYANNLDKERF